MSDIPAFQVSAVDDSGAPSVPQEAPTLVSNLSQTPAPGTRKKQLSGNQKRKRAAARKRAANGQVIVFKEIGDLSTIRHCEHHIADAFRDLRAGRIDSGLAYAISTLGKTLVELVGKREELEASDALRRAVESANAGPQLLDLDTAGAADSLVPSLNC